MEAKKIIVHEEYVSKTYQNDITLIMLKKSLDSTYMPACLAPKFEDYTGRVASLYGWGAIADTKLGKGCIRGASIQRSNVFMNFFPSFCLLQYLPQLGQSSFEDDNSNHHK